MSLKCNSHSNLPKAANLAASLGGTEKVFGGIGSSLITNPSRKNGNGMPDLATLARQAREQQNEQGSQYLVFNETLSSLSSGQQMREHQKNRQQNALPSQLKPPVQCNGHIRPTGPLHKLQALSHPSRACGGGSGEQQNAKNENIPAKEVIPNTVQTGAGGLMQSRVGNQQTKPTTPLGNVQPNTMQNVQPSGTASNNAPRRVGSTSFLPQSNFQLTESSNGLLNNSMSGLLNSSNNSTLPIAGKENLAPFGNGLRKNEYISTRQSCNGRGQVAIGKHGSSGSTLPPSHQVSNKNSDCYSHANLRKDSFKDENGLDPGRVKGQKKNSTKDLSNNGLHLQPVVSNVFRAPNAFPPKKSTEQNLNDSWKQLKNVSFYQDTHGVDRIKESEHFIPAPLSGPLTNFHFYPEQYDAREYKRIRKGDKSFISSIDGKSDHTIDKTCDFWGEENNTIEENHHVYGGVDYRRMQDKNARMAGVPRDHPSMVDMQQGMHAAAAPENLQNPHNAAGAGRHVRINSKSSLKTDHSKDSTELRTQHGRLTGGRIHNHRKDPSVTHSMKRMSSRGFNPANVMYPLGQGPEGGLAEHSHIHQAVEGHLPPGYGCYQTPHGGQQIFKFYEESRGEESGMASKDTGHDHSKDESNKSPGTYPSSKERPIGGENRGGINQNKKGKGKSKKHTFLTRRSTRDMKGDQGSDDSDGFDREIKDPSLVEHQKPFKKDHSDYVKLSKELQKRPTYIYDESDALDSAAVDPWAIADLPEEELEENSASQSVYQGRNFDKKFPAGYNRATSAVDLDKVPRRMPPPKRMNTRLERKLEEEFQKKHKYDLLEDKLPQEEVDRAKKLREATCEKLKKLLPKSEEEKERQRNMSPKEIEEKDEIRYAARDKARKKKNLPCSVDPLALNQVSVDSRKDEHSPKTTKFKEAFPYGKKTRPIPVWHHHTFEDTEDLINYEYEGPVDENLNPDEVKCDILKKDLCIYTDRAEKWLDHAENEEIDLFGEKLVESEIKQKAIQRKREMFKSMMGGRRTDFKEEDDNDSGTKNKSSCKGSSDIFNQTCTGKMVRMPALRESLMNLLGKRYCEREFDKAREEFMERKQEIAALKEAKRQLVQRGRFEGARLSALVKASEENAEKSLNELATRGAIEICQLRAKVNGQLPETDIDAQLRNASKSSSKGSKPTSKERAAWDGAMNAGPAGNGMVNVIVEPPATTSAAHTVPPSVSDNGGYANANQNASGMHQNPNRNENQNGHQSGINQHAPNESEIRQNENEIRQNRNANGDDDRVHQNGNRHANGYQNGVNSNAQNMQYPPSTPPRKPYLFYQEPQSVPTEDIHRAKNGGGEYQNITNDPYGNGQNYAQQRPQHSNERLRSDRRERAMREREIIEPHFPGTADINFDTLNNDITAQETLDTAKFDATAEVTMEASMPMVGHLDDMNGAQQYLNMNGMQQRQMQEDLRMQEDPLLRMDDDHQPVIVVDEDLCSLEVTVNEYLESTTENRSQMYITPGGYNGRGGYVGSMNAGYETKNDEHHLLFETGDDIDVEIIEITDDDIRSAFGGSRPGSANRSSRPGSSRPQSGRPQSGKRQRGRPQSGRPLSGRPQSGRPQSARPPKNNRSGAMRRRETPDQRRCEQNMNRIAEEPRSFYHGAKHGIYPGSRPGSQANSRPGSRPNSNPNSRPGSGPPSRSPSHLAGSGRQSSGRPQSGRPQSGGRANHSPPVGVDRQRPYSAHPNMQSHSQKGDGGNGIVFGDLHDANSEFKNRAAPSPRTLEARPSSAHPAVRYSQITKTPLCKKSDKFPVWKLDTNWPPTPRKPEAKIIHNAVAVEKETNKPFYRALAGKAKDGKKKAGEGGHEEGEMNPFTGTITEGFLNPRYLPKERLKKKGTGGLKAGFDIVTPFDKPTWNFFCGATKRNLEKQITKLKESVGRDRDYIAHFLHKKEMQLAESEGDRETRIRDLYDKISEEKAMLQKIITKQEEGKHADDQKKKEIARREKAEKRAELEGLEMLDVDAQRRLEGQYNLRQSGRKLLEEYHARRKKQEEKGSTLGKDSNCTGKDSNPTSTGNADTTLPSMRYGTNGNTSLPNGNTTLLSTGDLTLPSKNTTLKAVSKEHQPIQNNV